MIDLRSKARQRLLAYYFANPTARLHLRRLAGQLDIDPANLSKELRRLETEGLFRSEVNGRQKYFQLNRDYPLFAELRSIVSKTIGAPSLIAQALKKIEGIEEAYLYGSFASNQQDAASDIDALSDAMLDCLATPEKAFAPMGAAAHRKVWAMHDVDTETKKLVELIQQAAQAA